MVTRALPVVSCRCAGIMFLPDLALPGIPAATYTLAPSGEVATALGPTSPLALAQCAVPWGRAGDLGEVYLHGFKRPVHAYKLLDFRESE